MKNDSDDSDNASREVLDGKLPIGKNYLSNKISQTGQQCLIRPLLFREKMVDNWCPTCEETCSDHSKICTICGDELQPPPSSTTSPTDSRSRVVTIQDITSAFQEGSVPDVADVATGLPSMGADGWQQIPTQLLQPQNAAHRGRATSKAFLKRIPRITLEDKSSLFRQGRLTISRTGLAEGGLNLPVVSGEFGRTDAINLDDCTIIVGSPRTAKGGLDESCRDEIRKQARAIVYLERGDGITFVSKAIEAQQAGAIAVVIGNNMASPWPYTMKDSKGEAADLGLEIPVVMIKQSDGKDLIEFVHQPGVKVAGTLRIESLKKDCAVCCETFQSKDKIIQIPECNHCFHEPCALAWLTKHNTCPFCRLILPTDDKDYEDERRRTQQRHAGTESRESGQQWNEYYG